MQVVEQHVISQHDPRYRVLDAAAFAAKNLWNAANYLVRQSFIHEHVYLDNVKVYHLIKSHEAYKALPAKVSNQVLIQLHKAWVAFFEEAMEAWRQDPSSFLGRPKLPWLQRIVVVYARVSANENRPKLNAQAERLCAYCTAKGGQSGERSGFRCE